jgi:3-hydroxyacyl-[acyl-carrier-protein] dehydratase
VNTGTIGAMHGALEIPRDHPCFAGHFPKFPVLPGAVLLDEVLQVIQRERHIDLTQWRLTSAKFQAAVRPGDPLGVEHILARSGLINFTIRSTDRTVVTGSLSHAPPEGAA